MGPNRIAAETTVGALRDAGALEDVDEAIVAAFLSLASEVDYGEAKADLWREYRAHGQALKEAAAHAGDDDSQAFHISIQTPRSGGAQVGDPEKS